MKQTKTKNVKQSKLDLIKEIWILLFIIWLKKSIEQDILKMLSSSQKVPYTDKVPEWFTAFKPHTCIIEGKVIL